MKKKLLVGLAAGLFFFGIVGIASAAPMYVGSYAVYDGPNWWDNPDVFSAREAAALIFGGLYTDYFISIESNTIDSSTITHTAWYDGWGEHSGMVFDEDYKLDTGNPGYNDPAGVGTARSAYVHDGLSDTNTYRNYVWTSDAAPVPEPATMLLFGTGILGLVGYNRKRLADKN